MYTIETITIDHWQRAQKIALPQFIKVDVEGHEAQVFQGAADVIRSAKPIVMFEALTTEAMLRNVEILQDIFHEKYEFARVTKEAELVVLDSTICTVTNNFFAIPRWAKERFSDIPWSK